VFLTVFSLVSFQFSLQYQCNWCLKDSYPKCVKCNIKLLPSHSFRTLAAWCNCGWFICTTIIVTFQLEATTAELVRKRESTCKKTGNVFISLLPSGSQFCFVLTHKCIELDSSLYMYYLPVHQTSKCPLINHASSACFQRLRCQLISSVLDQILTADCKCSCLSVLIYSLSTWCWLFDMCTPKCMCMTQPCCHTLLFHSVLFNGFMFLRVNTPCLGKKRPQYFRHNFDKFRHCFMVTVSQHALRVALYIVNVDFELNYH